MQKRNFHIDEAVLWQYLTGELPDRERSAVEQWLSEKPEHRREFEKLREIYQHTEKPAQQNRFDADKAWQNIAPRLEEEPKVFTLTGFFRRYKSLSVAAAVLVGFILMITGLNRFYNEQAVPGQFITVAAIDDVEEVQLPDGSTVTLKPNAQLRYSEKFNTDRRTVELTGSAYFSVFRNPDLPFIVEGEVSQVQVLGTKFLFDQQGGITEVVVTEGKVAFGKKDEGGEKTTPSKVPGEEQVSVVLTAGEKGELTKEQKEVIKTINEDPNFLAWKTGVLQFDKTGLAEVVKKIEELYGVKIELSKPEFEKCTLTARFDNQNVDEVMETLSFTFGIQVQKDGQTYRINGEGC